MKRICLLENLGKASLPVTADLPHLETDATFASLFFGEGFLAACHK
jgi:hypothetical protein